MEIWIQQFFTSSAKPFFNLISDLGTGAPMLIGLLLVFLLFGTRTGVRAGLLFLAGSYLTFFLKFLIAAPRPYFVDSSIVAHSLSSGYGMPSGHATHTAAALSPLVSDAKSHLVKYLVVVFIGLVALSRVYLGVHYVSQVLLGLAIGIALYFLFERLSAPIVSRLKRLHWWVQVLLFTLPLVGLYSVDTYYLSSLVIEVPVKWQEGYDHAVDVRAANYGLLLTDPRVLEVKAEFSLIEPRGAEYYASLAGWLITCFIFLHHPMFTVRGMKHRVVNFAMGAGAVGALFAVFFVILSIQILQIGVLLIAPTIVAFIIPRVSEKWAADFSES